MEIVDQLGEHFLGFIFTGDIIEFNAGFRLDINLGVAFAEGHGIHASAAFHHLTHCKLADGNHDDNGQDPGQKECDQEGLLFYNFCAEGCPGCIKTVHQGRIFHGAGLIETGR